MLGSQAGLYFFLGITSFIMVTPFLWVFLTSFKRSTDIVPERPQLFPPVWILSHYLKLPKVAPFVRFFVNRIIVSGASTILVATGSAACGYVGRLRHYPPACAHRLSDLQDENHRRRRIHRDEALTSDTVTQGVDNFGKG